MSKTELCEDEEEEEDIDNYMEFVEREMIVWKWVELIHFRVDYKQTNLFLLFYSYYGYGYIFIFFNLSDIVFSTC